MGVDRHRRVAVSALAFDAETNTLLAAGTHGRLGHWRLDEATVRAEIVANGGDPLIEEEWARLIPPQLPHRLRRPRPWWMR